jgi:hypothetical protein
VRATNAYVTADLNTYATIARQWGKPAVVDRMLAAPTTRYLSPDHRLDWRNDDYIRREDDIEPRLDFLARFTKALADGGVPLVVGTDAPSIPGIAPGFSVHDDLDRLVAAGLTRRQALSAASPTGELPNTVTKVEFPTSFLLLSLRASNVTCKDSPCSHYHIRACVAAPR